MDHRELVKNGRQRPRMVFGVRIRLLKIPKIVPHIRLVQEQKVILRKLFTKVEVIAPWPS